MAHRENTLLLGAAEALPLPEVRGGASGRAMLALKAAVTLGALLLLFRLIDTHALLARLGAVPRPVLGIAVALLVVQIGLVAIRWRTVAGALPRPSGTLPRPARFVSITFAAVLLGQLMPAVAGDGLRVILARDAGLPLRGAIESTVLDRVVALLVLLVIALPATALSPLLRSTGIAGPTVAALSAALMLAFAAVAAGGPLSRARWRAVATVGDALRHLRAVLQGGGRAAFGLAALGHGLSMLVFALLAHGQALPLGLADCAAVVPLVLLIQMLPVAVGGWGLREGLLVALFAAQGIGAEDALLLSLLFGALQVVAALPGFWVLARSTGRRRPALA